MMTNELNSVLNVLGPFTQQEIKDWLLKITSPLVTYSEHDREVVGILRNIPNGHFSKKEFKILSINIGSGLVRTNILIFLKKNNRYVLVGSVKMDYLGNIDIIFENDHFMIYEKMRKKIIMKIDLKYIENAM